MGAKRRRALKERLMWEQKTLCHWCRQPIQTKRPRDSDFATIEHLTRQRHRTTNAQTNIVLACWVCNNRRG